MASPPPPLARLATLAIRLLGELVAPTRCAACDEGVGPRILFCAACGASVLPAVASPPGHHAVFDYGGAVATAIVRLKYAGRSDSAPRLADMMAGAAASLHGAGASVDLVVPVPLHPQRLVARGFDQAALLAAPVARLLHVPHAPRALLRVRETPPQASLDRAARAANVAAAFVCAAPRRIAHRRVLLVDDVRTTGATLAACADALSSAGAKEVRTLVLASRDRPQKVQKTPDDED